MTHIVSCNTSQLRYMPIAPSNDLPHCSLVLGKIKSGCVLLILFDTGVVLTTGLFPHHKNIIDGNPGAVHSFEKFEGLDPFDLIKLTGIVTNGSAYNAENMRFYQQWCNILHRIVTAKETGYCCLLYWGMIWQ